MDQARVEVEIIIRGPGNSGKSTLARLIRAGILDCAGLWVAPIQRSDTYPGAEPRPTRVNEQTLNDSQEADAEILRRLWPHVSIRIEEVPS